MDYKKALVITGRTVTALLLAFALLVSAFAVFSVLAFDRPDGKGVFGHKFLRVTSDAMTGAMETGDVAVVETVDTAQLQPGDIIAYKSMGHEDYGEVIFRQIEEPITYEGEPAFLTISLKTGETETAPALAERVVGRFTSALPQAGAFASFLRTPGGYCLLILLPYLLVLLVLALHTALLLEKRRAAQANTPPSHAGG